MKLFLKSEGKYCYLTLYLPSIECLPSFLKKNTNVKLIVTSQNTSTDLASVSNTLAFAAKAVGTDSSTKVYHGAGRGQQKTRPFCSHCKILGHTVDRCYKLHGYPLASNPNQNTIIPEFTRLIKFYLCPVIFRSLHCQEG